MDKQFLAVVADVRPKLHRFCARMCGSVLDGEDVVQETLAQAYYHLSSLKDPSRLEPWLFRIAHNRCLDFLRREQRPREVTVSYDDEQVREPAPEDETFDDEPVGEALAALVTELPPMERACVLLKDVLDYRLTEIADVADSTVGGVKAALHRGRAKLRALYPERPRAELGPEERRLVNAYIDCFNHRDWDALRRLVRSDARVELVGVTELRGAEIGTTYATNYGALPYEWKLAVARVDGEPLIVHWRKAGAEWRPIAAVRVWWHEGHVVRIRDYVHVDYLLRYARTELVP